MKCRNCGNEIRDDKKFCGKCGTPVFNKCPQCGKELSPEVRFCPDCGRSLVGNDRKMPTPPHASPPSDPPVKKGNAGEWIAIAAVLLLLILAGGFCVFRFVLPLMNQTTVEAENKSNQETPDDSGDKKNHGKETEEEDTEKAETEESTETKEATQEAVETTASSYIWGGSRKDETTAAWSSEPETTSTWDGLTNTEGTGYVLPDSNTKYLQESDLDGMGADQLRVARNEIYARHGRMFDSQDLQDYFNRQPWYTGSIAPNDFEESVLNSYEKANLEVIKAVEAKLK